MRVFLSLSLGLTLLCATGCATLARGDKQKMKFNTEPQGATVTLNDGKETQTLTTPATAKLKRKEKYNVSASKPGHQTVTFDMVAQWDGASLPGVILPGGSLSVAADTASGADRQFYTLETIKLPAGESGETLQMVQHRGKLYTQEEYENVLAAEEQYRQDIQMSN